jgi:predicted RNA binding protein YcfA (HicA-like mRNA interferase family)
VQIVGRRRGVTPPDDLHPRSEEKGGLGIMTEHSRRQKRRRKIAQNPRNICFDDLKRLLEDYGFELSRTKGSHHSFVGMIEDSKVTIVVPFRKPLQEVYIRHVLALLEQIEPLIDEQPSAESDSEDDQQDA